MTPTPQTLLTVPDMARRFHFSAQAIYAAIKRHDIEPHTRTEGGISLYSEEQATAIGELLSPSRRDEQKAAL